MQDDSADTQMDYRSVLARVNSGLRHLQEAQQEASATPLVAGPDAEGANERAEGDAEGGTADEIETATLDFGPDSFQGAEAHPGEVEEIVQLIEEVNMAVKQAGTRDEVASCPLCRSLRVRSTGPGQGA